MKPESYKIFPLGVDALTIEFGNEISVESNNRVVQLARSLERDRFAGFLETVPAYSSLTVFYDVFAVRKNRPNYANAFATVKDFVENALKNLEKINSDKPRLIEIPVDFSNEYALDLETVADRNDLTKEQVVEIFTAKVYRVFMLGFLPAFAYMGKVDERIAAPRKSSPRLIVPQGSVGIAGRQTGIYPFDSPGGWQIIGRTNYELFTPHAENPCALQAGDSVKFYATNE